MYCGNNKLSKDLLSGIKKLGTRYDCLRRGFGAGYNSKKNVDSYGDNYEPLTEDKFYCGKQKLLSNSYSRFGTLADCFRRGYGLGLKKKFLNKNSVSKSKKKSRKKSKKKSKKKSRKKSRKKSKKKSRKKSRK